MVCEQNLQVSHNVHMLYSPVPANDIAIENIFFYTFWFKYSTSIYKYIFNLCYYLFFKRNVFYCIIGHQCIKLAHVISR